GPTRYGCPTDTRTQNSPPGARTAVSSLVAIYGHWPSPPAHLANSFAPVMNPTTSAPLLGLSNGSIANMLARGQLTISPPSFSYECGCSERSASSISRTVP